MSLMVKLKFGKTQVWAHIDREGETPSEVVAHLNSLISNHDGPIDIDFSPSEWQQLKKDGKSRVMFSVCIGKAVFMVKSANWADFCCVLGEIAMGVAKGSVFKEVKEGDGTCLYIEESDIFKTSAMPVTQALH